VKTWVIRTERCDLHIDVTAHFLLDYQPLCIVLMCSSVLLRRFFLIHIYSGRISIVTAGLVESNGSLLLGL